MTPKNLCPPPAERRVAEVEGRRVHREIRSPRNYQSRRHDDRRSQRVVGRDVQAALIETAEEIGGIEGDRGLGTGGTVVAGLENAIPGIGGLRRGQ